MIDFHSHILYGLDDGIQAFEDSILVLKEAKQAGFNKIICTTHYSNYFKANEERRKERIEELKKQELGVELILGNEIYATSNIDELINAKEASTINNSDYILFEIPLHDNYPQLRNLIINLISKGYKLVLAHPERYVTFQQNPKLIEEVLDLGIYLQANYMSIDGLYGKEAKRLVELLYKHNMISFLGTDIHRTCKYYPNIKKAKEKIIDIVGAEQFELMSEKNIELVLENQEVENQDYIPIEKTILGRYR